MSHELITKEGNLVTINLTVAADEFEGHVEKAYQKNKGKYSVQGFRKGKAPRKTLESHYGEGLFFEDAIDSAFPEAYTAAIEELNIEPVARPSLDVLSIGKGEDLKLEVKVVVKPEVKIGNYKGIEIEKIEVKVSDEDVQSELEKSREANGRLISVEDRAVQDGDTVNMDYAGFVGEEQFEGGTAEGQTLVIGSGRFIPGFEEQLVGKNIGDDVEVSVTFPEEYHAENLAGKDAIFKVKINGIKYKELPDLDDEFAKDTSEFDTLEELKADIKAKLLESLEKSAESATRDRVIGVVMETLEADIPNEMIETEIDGMLRDFDYELRYQGADLQKYLEFSNLTLDSLRADMRSNAEDRVKTGLVLEEVAKLENIQVESDDIEKELARIAEREGSTVEEMRKYFERDDYEYIKMTLKTKKTVDMMVESAIIK